MRHYEYIIYLSFERHKLRWNHCVVLRCCFFFLFFFAEKWWLNENEQRAKVIIKYPVLSFIRNNAAAGGYSHLLTCMSECVFIWCAIVTRFSRSFRKKCREKREKKTRANNKQTQKSNTENEILYDVRFVCFALKVSSPSAARQHSNTWMYNLEKK